MRAAREPKASEGPKGPSTLDSGRPTRGCLASLGHAKEAATMRAAREPKASERGTRARREAKARRARPSACSEARHAIRHFALTVQGGRPQGPSTLDSRRPTRGCLASLAQAQEAATS